MNDAERLPPIVGRLVGGVQPLEDSNENGHDDGHGDGPAAVPGRAPQASKRLTGHVLHDEKELARQGHDIERADDVGMTHARREPRLVEEHRDELGIFGELRVQSLDGHGPRKADRP